MYLSGSKWNLRRKGRGSRPWRVLFLLAVIVGLVFLWQIYIPTIPPPFVPTPTPTRSSAAIELEAESLFESGRLTQAEEAYRAAISVNPQEITYYIDLARVLVFMGDYENAELAARDALVVDGDSPLGHAVLGWVLDFKASTEEDDQIRSALLDNALSEVERALSSNPGSALIQAYYAEVLIDHSPTAYTEARQAAEEAIRLAPNLLEAHRALGYVYEVTQNYELALENYLVAASFNPRLPLLHINVGNMQRALGDYASAEESYLNAVALAPENPEPLALLANLNANVGEYGKASQYAEQAVALDPTNPRLRGLLGRMLFSNGDYDGALIQLELATRGGQSPGGEWVEGLSLVEAGQTADLRVVEYYTRYAMTLARQGRCEGSEGAIAIAEALLTNFEDEITVFNAREALITCGELEREPTPTPEATSGS
jgi:tetratricopeptide (TPR) repeat protein